MGEATHSHLKSGIPWSNLPVTAVEMFRAKNEVVPGQSLPTLLNACHATYQHHISSLQIDIVLVLGFSHVHDA